MATQLQCIYINQKNTNEKLEVSVPETSFTFFSTIFTFSCVPLDYVKKYATEDALREQEDDSDSSESTMSDFSDDETKDMEL